MTSTPELRFDGQVAIVTGAGRGIGRAHARLLAARGAHVVVNDLGVDMDGSIDMDGSRGNAGPAQQTVDTIVAAGGSAVVDTNDIATPEGAAGLAAHALERFGQLDILVNNAGIYRTDTFPDVDLADLRRLLDIHVGGSLLTAQACWPHMVDAGYGRIVLTTSTGALGHSHLTGYGAAKASVIALTRAIAALATASAADLKVNALAPMALTRMMAAHNLGGADPEPDPQRHPDLVAPMAAVLAHRSCPVQGEILMAGMRRYTRLTLSETDGYVHDGIDVTPELLVDRWDTITDTGRQETVTNTETWAVRNQQAIDAVT